MGPPSNAQREDESSAGEQLQESSSRRGARDAAEREASDGAEPAESADGESGHDQEPQSGDRETDDQRGESAGQAGDQESASDGDADMGSVEIQAAQEVTIEEASEAGPDEGSTVLSVLLEGLHVNLLGLEIHLPELDLDVSAVPGEGRLLGNLLSRVAGLLDGGGDGLSSGLLGKLSPGSILGKLSPRSLLGGLKNRVLGMLPFVGGSGESSEGEEATGDEGADDESDTGGSSDESSGDEETDAGTEGDQGAADSDDAESNGETPGSGILGSIGSRLRSAVGSLLPSLPIERAVTWLVETGLKRLIRAADRRAGGADGSSSGDERAEQATATDGGRSVESNRAANNCATAEEYDE
ncbi:hypothetical protein [Halovivax limisalsi]|uniref:hypothetical protein n=1 Tax=Halovivax limisalsi TaxID=1453760 RepID=UPI001FFD7779|nr:hypothetical protein [Halovivax limisalsi]